MRPGLLVVACCTLLQSCATVSPPATAPDRDGPRETARPPAAEAGPAVRAERPVATPATPGDLSTELPTDVPTEAAPGDSLPPPQPGADARGASDALGGTADDEAAPTSPAGSEARPPEPRPESARADAIPGLCEELGALLGSVSIDACLASDLLHGDGRSHDGRPLAWAEFPARAPDAPRILVIGGIHGDEYSSISMVFRWIERLREDHDEARSWRLVPAANPDGLLGVAPARRTNARGVDLNRNFATPDWAREARTWWVQETRRDPRRDPGTAPASEVETRWMQALIARWRPDVIVSIHAPHALLDFDASARMRVEAPQRLGFLQLQPLGTFPGSLGRYGSLTADVPVLTLELPWAGIMPSAEDQTALWQDLEQWLGTHLPAPRTGERLTGP